MKNALLFLGGAGLLASAAQAQTAQTIDPVTGQYVPVKDPFLAGSPDAGNNPNRLANRSSRRVGVKMGPVGSRPSQDLDKTASQRAAGDSVRNGAGDASEKVKNGQISGQTPANPASTVAANRPMADTFASLPGYDRAQPVMMDDMIQYHSPDDPDTDNKDPFALPDWWPSGKDAQASAQVPNN